MTGIMVTVATVTHRGLVREGNEDAAGIAGWVLTSRQAPALPVAIEIESATDFLVADGLGGHRGGERASRQAVEAVFAHDGDLGDAVIAADESVHRLADSDPRLHGMGTTIVGARLWPDGSMLIVNVGDCRAYRLVDGYLGLLSEDDRPAAGGAGLVTQVLGGSMRVTIEPHRYETVVGPADVILLCTDGLYDVVDEAAIVAALALPHADAAAALVDLALDAGAPDNVTVMVFGRSPEPSAR